MISGIWCLPDLVFHTLELPKYVVPGDNVLHSLPKLEQWFCFLKKAADQDIHELARMLGDEVFEEAAEVLEMIFQSPEDRQFYAARVKYLHDEEARLIAAREEGLAEGMEKGAAKGSLAGKIQVLQDLLGDDENRMQDLLQLGSDVLAAMLSELQERLRSRGD